jgi:hypothetical protein
MPDAKLWQLELGGEVVAVIRQVGHDQPWTLGDILDTTKFHRFRVYFDGADDWLDVPENEAIYDEIHERGGFRLRDTTTGEVFRNVTLNHDGRDGVWFRYS